MARLQASRRQRQQSTEYLQTLLDTVPAALLVIQADGEFALVNRAAVRLAGDAARSTLLRVLGANAANALVGLAPGTHQILRPAAGQQVLASAAQFLLPGGAPQRLVSLQRLAGELDAVELKAWDDMVRVLAHEMMNSLTPIASLSESLESLLRSGRTADVSDSLEVISRRSQGLMRFVERYRKVAELPQPTLQHVSLRALLAGIEQLHRASYAAAGIELRITVTPPDASAMLDADLIEQAVINLLRNAADAVAGFPQPLVEIECSQSEGQLRNRRARQRPRPRRHGARAHLRALLHHQARGLGRGSFARAAHRARATAVDSACSRAPRAARCSRWRCLQPRRSARPLCLRGFCPRQPFHDDAPRHFGVAPAHHLHPLRAFQILVVLEEVTHLHERDLRQVGVVVHVLVATRQAWHRHGDDLLVAARLVLHLQHAHRAHRDHRTGRDAALVRDEHVARVTVVGTGCAG